MLGGTTLLLITHAQAQHSSAQMRAQQANVPNESRIIMARRF